MKNIIFSLLIIVFVSAQEQLVLKEGGVGVVVFPEPIESLHNNNSLNLQLQDGINLFVSLKKTEPTEIIAIGNSKEIYRVLVKHTSNNRKVRSTLRLKSFDKTQTPLLIKRKVPKVPYEEEDSIWLTNKSVKRYWNFAMAGDKEIAPQEVFHDGTFTYFVFKERQYIPSFFLIFNEGESPSEVYVDQNIVTVKYMGDFVMRLMGKKVCVKLLDSRLSDRL